MSHGPGAPKIFLGHPRHIWKPLELSPGRDPRTPRLADRYQQPFEYKESMNSSVLYIKYESAITSLLENEPTAKRENSVSILGHE